MSNISEQPGGKWQTRDAHRVFDFLSEASSAVLMAFSAIEGVANSIISELPDSAQLTVTRKGLAQVYEKDSMVRWLSISEKLDQAVPMLTGDQSVKGTATWGKFVRLRRLRDDLVHVKAPKPDTVATEPVGHARLIRGDGESAVTDAVEVIRAISPIRLTEAAIEQLEMAGFA